MVRVMTSEDRSAINSIIRKNNDDGKPSHLKRFAVEGFADDAWGHGTCGGHVQMYLDTMDWKSGNIWASVEDAEELIGAIRQAVAAARQRAAEADLRPRLNAEAAGEAGVALSGHAAPNIPTSPQSARPAAPDDHKT